MSSMHVNHDERRLGKLHVAHTAGHTDLVNGINICLPFADIDAERSLSPQVQRVDVESIWNQARIQSERL